jgi:manganese transport protein
MHNYKSIEEIHRTVSIPKNGSFWKKLLAFSGPGYLVAVGYMDPGNWATSLAGGSQFGYTLLSIVFLSNCMAILLQYLALKLGIVTSKDLAQACRDYYGPKTAFFLWILAEIAIIACDIAEVIGSAIALNLLFSIPLSLGVLITAADVFVILLLQNKSFRYLELLVTLLILVILGSFTLTIYLAQPELLAVLRGFIPTTKLITDPSLLYLAIGILGATVMPHNLYLHSALVQSRKYPQTDEGKREAIRFSFIDSTLALTVAFFINAGILILAAATFYTRGYHNVAELQDAYQLLSVLLSSGVASAVFAIALLASGQNATVTGTLAGQIIMEGFITLTLAPWLRRLMSRSLAIIPAALAVIYFGQQGLAQLLLVSQVVLSFQLPFAVWPLIQFTCSKKNMGVFANSISTTLLACLTAAIITGLNIWLVVLTVTS